ncbi:MAG: S8 family serine peptidase [Bradymonadia bacterium]
MRQHNHIFITTFIATGIFACGGAQGNGPVVGTSAQSLSFSRTPTATVNTASSQLPSQPLGTSEACSGDRWVGRYDNARNQGCPRPYGAPDYVENWSVAPLYDDALGALPGAMADACVYEWNGDQPINTAPNLGTQQNPIQTAEWLHADCHVVGVQGGPAAATAEPRVADVLLDDLRGNFQALMSDVDIMPIDQGQNTLTRISVVDTAVTDYDRGRPSYGRYEHGRDMGLISRQLACKDTGCPTLIDSRLGLPRVNVHQADPVNGGYFGYQTELAQGIYNAVAGWHHDNRFNGSIAFHHRLVINLSVGWSDVYGGPTNGNPATLPPPVREVYDAIRFARCNGAMVVASAGNTEFGSTPESGPLYPAGWGTERAPNVDACVNDFPSVAVRIQAMEENNRPIFGGNMDPLVYPVAGLTAEDQPVFNARPDTLTPLMAPAHQVAANDYDPNGTGRIGAPVASGIYTGSSVAAAAVSGTAAAVWSIDASLSPYDVHQLLHRTGVQLNSLDDADIIVSSRFGGRFGRNKPRRVAICSAIERACARNPVACDSVELAALQSACAPLGEGEGADYGFVNDHSSELADFYDDLDASETTEITFDEDSMSEATRSGCDGGDLLYSSSAEDAPGYDCQPELHPTPASKPWVGPQPGLGTCPDCLIDNLMIYMPVSNPDPTTSIKDPSVTLYTDAGETKTIPLSEFDSSLSEITKSVTIKAGDISVSGEIKEAYFTYGIEGKDGASYSGKEAFTIYK